MYKDSKVKKNNTYSPHRLVKKSVTTAKGYDQSFGKVSVFTKIKKSLSLERQIILRSARSSHNFTAKPWLQISSVCIPVVALVLSISYGYFSGEKSKEDALARKNAEHVLAEISDSYVNRISELKENNKILAKDFIAAQNAWSFRKANYENEIAEARSSYAEAISILGKQQEFLNQQIDTIFRVANNRSLLASVPNRFKISEGTTGIVLAFQTNAKQAIVSRDDVGPFADISFENDEPAITYSSHYQSSVPEHSDIDISNLRGLILHSPDNIAQGHQRSLNRFEENLAARVNTISEMLHSAGLSHRVEDTVLAQQINTELGGVGGPFVSPELAKQNSNLTTNEINQISKISKLMSEYAKLKRILNSVPLGAPLIKRFEVTSNFGIRDDPFLSTPAFHGGIDLGGREGDPIITVLEGEVSKVGNSKSFGKYVAINHGGGIESYYGHLSKIAVKRGEFVAPTDVIGYVGSTGRSTGPHLHYEIVVDGDKINPGPLIQAQKYVQ